MSKRVYFQRLPKGVGLFKIGVETYLVDEEVHYPWGSSTSGAKRVWAISLGLWEFEWVVPVSG